MENNQIPVEQPITPPPTIVIPAQPKQSQLPVIILSLLSLIFLSGMIYFYLQAQSLKELTSSKEVNTTSVTQNTPTPIPTTGPTLNWKSYVYQNIVEIKVPEDYKIVDKGYNYIQIGNNISISSSEVNPEDCKGDCYISGPLETKVINGISVKYASGYWGEIGGNIAQNFIAYIIPANGKYIQIQLQELPFDAKYESGRKLVDISAEQIELFNQIIATLKLVN